MPRKKSSTALAKIRNANKFKLQKELDSIGVKGMAEKYKVSKSSIYKIITEKKLKLQKYKSYGTGTKTSKKRKQRMVNMVEMFWPCFVRKVCIGSKCHIYYGTTKNPLWNPDYCLSIGCVQIPSAKYRDGVVFFEKNKYRYKKFW